MYADSQGQRVIGSVVNSELRVTCAQQIQSQISDLAHVTVAIATRKTAYNHVWVTDRLDL